MPSYKKMLEDLVAGRASYETDKYRLNQMLAKWETNAPSKDERSEAIALLNALADNKYGELNSK